MSKISYYTDEQIPKAVVRGLRQRGVNVLATPEAGNRQASDEVQLAFATSQGRVLFTQDDDFLRLAASGIQHSGIVYTTQQMSIGDIIQGLMLIYQVIVAEEMIGHIEYL